MRISDWSSDVCSSDLIAQYVLQRNALVYQQRMARRHGGYQRIVPHRPGEAAIAHLIGLGKAHIVKIAAQSLDLRREQRLAQTGTHFRLLRTALEIRSTYSRERCWRYVDNSVVSVIKKN